MTDLHDICKESPPQPGLLPLDGSFLSSAWHPHFKSQDVFVDRSLGSNDWLVFSALQNHWQMNNVVVWTTRSMAILGCRVSPKWRTESRIFQPCSDQDSTWQFPGLLASLMSYLRPPLRAIRPRHCSLQKGGTMARRSSARTTLLRIYPVWNTLRQG